MGPAWWRRPRRRGPPRSSTPRCRRRCRSSRRRRASRATSARRRASTRSFAEIMDIKWMREAEIKHGRVAILATIGYTYPEMPWFAQAFPGDAYSHSNPIKAALAVPPEAWAQVVLFCGVMEWSLNGGRVTMMTMFDGTSRAPGDFGWDPMGLMSPANEERMKMRELQHGRLAMIAIGGMIHGSFVTGTGVFGGMN